MNNELLENNFVCSRFYWTLTWIKVVFAFRRSIHKKTWKKWFERLRTRWMMVFQHRKAAVLRRWESPFASSLTSWKIRLSYICHSSAKKPFRTFSLCWEQQLKPKQIYEVYKWNQPERLDIIHAKNKHMIYSAESYKLSILSLNKKFFSRLHG